MKARIILYICLFWMALPCGAQQRIYRTHESLLSQKGELVSGLVIDRRSFSQISLYGGADYHISSETDSRMSEDIKRRFFAVELGGQLYVNMRHMKYKRYRFGSWYAPAFIIRGHLFFVAQPLGQAATVSITQGTVTRLGGQVGDAIAASALVTSRVVYEVNPQSGRAEFVGKERAIALLKDRPDLQRMLAKEKKETVDVIFPYLNELK